MKKDYYKATIQVEKKIKYSNPKNIDGLIIEDSEYVNTFNVKNVIIHCKTQEEYSKMITFFHATQSDRNWTEYKENSGMRINQNGHVYYCYVPDYYTTMKYKLVYASDIINKYLKPINKLTKTTMKKETKFKKGVITTTQEVTKKVPAPKYSTLKEYMLHIEGKRVIYLSPLYIIYHEEDEQWYYYINNTIFNENFITEEEFTKALIVTK